MKVAVLIPCYKRPEYTQKCIKALEEAQEYKDTMFYLVNDGSQDNTTKILLNSKLPKVVVCNMQNTGLRSVIIEFFKATKEYDMIAKIDNDSCVPKNWLNDLLRIHTTTDVDILSPNILPSNSGLKLGKESDKGYRPATHVGGHWMMRRDYINDMSFDKYGAKGILGAFEILKSIIMDKDPNIGWTSEVNIDNMGHWTGKHPDHIKSEEHLAYSHEVGRGVAW